MASFRTGFKIIGEFSLKQGLGRIRSFSEDKRPSRWLPEDQWAVRQPTSTCPDLCAKKKKAPKASKSWLSLCKDPNAPKEPECDIRHNNCPPPPVRESSPWYSLDKFISKKPPEKPPPPLESCCEERRRRAISGDDEEVCCEPVCEPQEPPPCIPKKVCPAPVVTLSCPLPKELNLMLWCDCGKGSPNANPIHCQDDRLPYDEFRPQKIWKPPPFSLPCKIESTFTFPPCCSSSIPFSEFKYVDVPKPMYTRYKSVELGDSQTLFCMADVQCKEDGTFTLGVKSNMPPPPPPIPLNPEPTKKKDTSACEKCVLEAASRKPVKLKKATKFIFTPKPTKLVERRVYKDRFGNIKCNLPFIRPPVPKNECDCKEEELAKSNETESEESNEKCSKKPASSSKKKSDEQTKEPKVYEGIALKCRPPKWMFVLCKPGSKSCPLLPCSKDCGSDMEDWSCEANAPRKSESSEIKPHELPKCPKEPPLPPVEIPPPAPDPNCRFVLMPEKYNIKLMRSKEVVEEETNTVEKVIQEKATPTNKCPNPLYPIKENILYDLQRLCPAPPLDPSKRSVCRKPPKPTCPSQSKFTRSFSTVAPSPLKKLCLVELCEIPRRTACNDTSGKCKARDLTPKTPPCPEPRPPPDCAEITLPCCPKARVPPNCNTKKALPTCKKKLAPKPSFSECSKDPPPCPRPTECTCWKKGLGKKH